jgi:hypothetical protein
MMQKQLLLQAASRKVEEKELGVGRVKAIFKIQNV